MLKKQTAQYLPYFIAKNIKRNNGQRRGREGIPE